MTYGRAMVVWIMLQPCALTGTTLTKHWREGRAARTIGYIKSRYPKAALNIVRDITTEDPSIGDISKAIQCHTRPR